jgi:pimeloyl-ACP methyl ester carboxylesterase
VVNLQKSEEDFMTGKLRHSFVTRDAFITVLALAVVLMCSAAATAQGPGATDAQSLFAKLDLAPSGGKGEARVHYKSYGKGNEALILIHGWTCNLDYWRDSVADLSKRNRVIAIDLPGHGQSDKPEIAYSMELFARAVDAVMRDAKVERAVLVGHSMGTPVARQFYRKYPEKTLGIVIVDGSLRPFGDKKLMEGFIAGFRGPNYREAGKQMFAGMAGPNLSPQTQERIQASFLNTPQHVIVSAMEGMADDSIWGPDKINVPVLAFMAKSPFWPPDTEEFFRSIAPNLDFQMLAGVGHFLMMEKPKEFDAAVIAFLDKNKLVKR